MARQEVQESEGPGRRLWRVDLNDVHVVDEAGVEYGVEMTRGDLNGPLRVMIRSEDVPLSVAENLAAALEAIAHEDRPSHEAAREALAEFRAAYPAKETRHTCPSSGEPCPCAPGSTSEAYCRAQVALAEERR